jgi:general secretion pathway protein J
MKEGPSLPRRRSLGFTLVEVLVVMSLLSVVMLALGSALRTVAQTEERIEQRLRRADEMRIAVGFMGAVVRQISGRKVVRQPPAEAEALFVGTPASMSWVGVMPARYGAGGRYFFRLSVEADGNEGALVIRFLPWVDSPAFPDWSGAESRVLVRGVTRAGMAYADTDRDVALVGTWSTPGRVPDQVRIDVQTTAGPWPPLHLPMRIMPTSEPGLGRASFGPGG